MKNIYWLIGGVINLFTALLHTVAGQEDLINPMLNSPLTNQVKFELLGAWHMVTLLMFFTAFVLLANSLKSIKDVFKGSITFIGWIYILMSLPSLTLSIIHGMLIPQWILLFPIGLFSLLGNRKALVQ